MVLSDATVQVWDLKDRRLRSSFGFPYSNRPGRVAFTPSGEHFLALVSGYLAIWETSGLDLIRLYRGMYREKEGIAISPDGEWLAVQLDDPGKKLMRTVDGEVFYLDQRIPFVRIYRLADLLAATP